MFLPTLTTAAILTTHILHLGMTSGILSVPLHRLEEAELAFAIRAAGIKPSRLPTLNPTRSFWIDTPHANPLAREGSTGQLSSDADICIIGAGITGVSTAYHLANLTSARIVILEARDFCSGATGRNGGHLTPAAFLDFKRHAAAFGVDEAIRSLALERHTVNALLEILQSNTLNDAVDLVAGGHIDVLFSEREVANARADYAAAEAAGIQLDQVEWLTSEQMQSTYGTSHPAARFPGHNLWPLKLVTELYKLAKAVNPNISLHTQTPVTSVDSIVNSIGGGRQWNVTTPRGSIRCNQVVHATNAYASHLLPEMTGRIMPTRGQIIALRAAVSLKELTTSGWGGNEGFEYWFPRPIKHNDTLGSILTPSNELDGAQGVLAQDDTEEHPLVILGGGREALSPHFELGQDDDSVLDPIVGKTLRNFLPEVFPGKYKAGKKPEMEWSGIMGYTQMMDPFVGPVVSSSNVNYDGQYIAAGFSGHGMPRTFGCAEVIAQMVHAEITGNKWVVPEWLPQRYLTTKRTGVNGSEYTFKQ